jgi:carbamoyl-phosphate synthase large subunit
VIKNDEVLVIEANPRASRTIPYLSKAIGHPLAKYAALIAAGKTLEQLGFSQMPRPTFYSVKEVVLPFLKFKNVLPILGPEMRSTGESMGIAKDPYLAYYKAELGANVKLPTAGKILCIGHDLSDIAAGFRKLGFEVTEDETAFDPSYTLLIDTSHSQRLRQALENGSAYITTKEAAHWTLQAIRAAQTQATAVNAVQDLTGTVPIEVTKP